MRKNKVILTRRELDALHVYAEKVRRETIDAIFTDVEELLRMRYRFEDQRSDICEDEHDRSRHFYGRNVCESLLIDLQKIERKYTDDKD